MNRLLLLTGLTIFSTLTISAAGVRVAELDDRIRIEIDGELFTEWRHREWVAPYFYPVIGPNGEAITRNYPMKEGVAGESQDHPHHRSLRFAHSDVNGLNFWYWRPGRERELSTATIVLEKIETLSSGQTGKIVLWNRWLDGDELVLREKLRVTVIPLENRQVLMDYDVELHAGEKPVTFGDMKDGGMLVRVAGTMKAAAHDKEGGEKLKGAIVNSRGDRDEDAWGKRAEWVDYFGPDASGETVGIAMFDHPDNLRFPAHWHARTYGLLTANRFGQDHFDPKFAKAKGVSCRPHGTECPACNSRGGDYTIAAGEKLLLRHRFYFHHGDAETAEVARHFQEYARDRAPQAHFRILPPEFNADKEHQMMRAFQRKQVHAALDARLEELESALQSPESLAAYQQERREFLKDAFGPLPKRTPLNARVTATIQREGHRVENVLFESLPGYLVTANLYVPDGSGPFPAVLLPCGHSANGKAYEAYQKAAILLANHGFVVLCFDPVGQGERRQLIGPEPHPILKPRGEHNQLGVAPILLGRPLSAMMVWDGMRGIDYLCSRPEVDPSRIGCTGNSGGGNLTSYLMAFDDRIRAAAPGCFMTTHRRKNEFPGPGDAEQNLHGQIRDGFDHPDFILARAPKPTLILAATHDYVPIAGAWEAFRQAKRAYTVLGHPERVELVETNDKHGFSKRLREGAARFLTRWLQGRHEEIFESDHVPILSDEDLQVTPHGQVNWLPEARSIFDVLAESEQELISERPSLTPKVVREATGIRSLARLPEPKVEVLESDGRPTKLVIHPEPGIALPALHWADGDERPILMAPGEGMNSAVGQAREWNAEGHPVLVVEVRDTGETATRNWRFPGADSFIGQMLGRSWLAMRSEDLLISARWLVESSGQSHVAIHATGEAAPAALHAGFLEPELVTEVQVKGGLNSWRELMTSREAYGMIHQAVQGALRSYDLPDLKRSPKTTMLYQRMPIPDEFLTTENGHTFGGDLRIGDLNGDARCDFLVYRSADSGPGGPAVGGHKPAFLGAFDMDGTILWSAGKSRGGTHPVRPGSVAVHDLDGDGAAEVICFWHRPGDEVPAGWDSLTDVVVQIRDGKTGKILREAAPSAITRRSCVPKPGEKISIGRLTANWVHQRILVANLRGTERPRDFVIKLGDTHVALDENLDPLWTYQTPWIDYSRCPSYIPSVGDIDGDGRDEVNAGYFLLDDDGTPLWEKRLGDHMDSVAITEWDGGNIRAICSGFGHVMDATGNVVLSLGKEEVPHGQEVRVANFRADLPGPEMALRHQGHTPALLLISSASNAVIDRRELNAVPNNTGMEPVLWNGPDRPALLFNGDRLWDLESGRATPLPGLPPPNGAAVHRMGFYHAIPADLCGDRCEELVLWDPTATEVLIYTSGPVDETAYQGYQAGPRQYNARIMD